ncbi:MAG: aminoacyl-tRNA hydrolase [Akkermansia sp.]|nr:aminoacyl-tRNA hydrolase [Akkermansia sp.]
MLPVKIIVGLGNPGREYAETRHNVGFMVLDLLARHFGAEWKADKARKAELAAGPGVLLVKPQTYMNASGESVGPLMRYYKWEPEQVFVIYDDISFPVGTMRLRAGGSAGGHNGMKSMIAHLGTEKFPRLRVGISAPGCKQMVSHVLGKFAPDERPLLNEALARAAAATLMTLSHGFDAAANQFNIKKEKKKKEKPAPEEAAPAAVAEPAAELSTQPGADCS